ncbi:ferritin-like domain-containing protein [Actinorugispora endophytica]|uniref:Ferritin-like protein n=1 Tax=Actinorugispora endophytica TaxID=1605990 RepID=A0A4R6V194_9ACTN|nr:ferritin-like domain-containing protein [Actinorugispora endophytica]TDQ52140.1 hypothetical protein EV190_108122 [Actinorugispora endophytica]
MRHDALNRRTVLGGALAAAAALGLGGCRGADWYPSEISPDEYLLRSAIAEKQRLIARYAALLDNGRSTDPELHEAFRSHHERHLAVLRERLPEHGGGEPSPSASPEARPDPDERGLRVAEEAAAANRLRQLGEAADPALAQLFAGIGACEAGHAHSLPEA